VLLDEAKLLFLQRNGRHHLSKGTLNLEDIIGRPVASKYVRSSKGSLHKIELPSLEDYIRLTPRNVTPVYASYASTIVSLLDINPAPYVETQSGEVSPPQLQILEAGTGHGSLTMHLARAIAVANRPPPTGELPKFRMYNSLSPLAGKERSEAADETTQAWIAWKVSRRAVIHTIEAMPSYSTDAEKTIRGFRQGLYWPHIDFYVADVKDWINDRLAASRDEPEFLDYVLLDMPGVHERIAHVAPAMRDGAKLLVFVPSITQIGECVKTIAKEALPLKMVNTLELGEGISNGRRWDVRLVQPRIISRKLAAETASNDSESGPDSESHEADERTGETPDSANEEVQGAELERESTSPAQEPVMICRPMVGERTFGGGFIAVFKKFSTETAAIEAEWKHAQPVRPKWKNR
jgi:tRNA A58 N-methylase Trm61